MLRIGALLLLCATCASCVPLWRYVPDDTESSDAETVEQHNDKALRTVYSEAFDDMDVNKDGKLSKKEFDKALLYERKHFDKIVPSFVSSS